MKRKQKKEMKTVKDWHEKKAERIEVKIKVPKHLIADMSPEAMDVLNDLELDNSFRMSKETNFNFFYDLVNYSTTVATVEELKEQVLDPIAKVFGEEMLRIKSSQNNSHTVVCKYNKCPYKLNFKANKPEDGGDHQLTLRP